MSQTAKENSIKVNNSKNLLAIFIFTISLFLSASLMFAVQPMVGKMLLPITGGTPASWIVAMAFFQIALLAGYMLAWIMSRFEVRVHTIILILLLTLGYFTLPVKISEYSYILDERGIAPISIFILLCLAIGLPFTAISTVSSTLQRLFTATDHEHSHDPYFLYAASNAGSLIGLLSYPILIEPIFTISEQIIYWQYLYGALILMAVFCLLIAHGSKKTKSKNTTDTTKAEDIDNLTWKRRIEWLLLAFFPSSLLMGTTMHVTTDIVSVPLLWVIPLGLYLLTHIIAFSKKEFFDKELLYTLHPIAVCVVFLISIHFMGMKILTYSWAGAIVVIIAFFIIALALHTRLASIRPHSKYLTEFYFFLALGGALGGSLNAFLAPVILNGVYELPLIAFLSCLVNPYLKSDTRPVEISILLVGLLMGIIYAILYFTTKSGEDVIFDLLKAGILLSAISMIFGSNAKIAAYGIPFLFVPVFMSVKNTDILTHRNFFGVSKIYEETYNKGQDKEQNVRFFVHGTTLHGVQNLDADVKTSPVTSYYGPLRDIIDTYKPKHVGLLGLGAGVIRCYYAPDRYFTMYEIDKDVVEIAKKYFDFLKECGSPKDKIIIGDGRLEMEKRKDDKYDLIIMDAFTSDNVPAHLLTKEAMQIYKNRLSENGLIAIHVSNRYLDLKRVIVPTASAIGFKSLLKHIKKNNYPLEFGSTWIVIAPEDFDLSALSEFNWAPVKKSDIGNKIWTDEYTNILSILR